MMELQGYLTCRGEALLAAALSGGAPLTFTRAAAGSGATDLSATVLAEEQQALTLGAPKKAEQGVLLPVTLVAAEAGQAYALTEVGVYAQDEETESLYAVYRLTPALNIDPTSGLSVRLELEECFSEVPAVTVSPAGTLTYADLQSLKGVPSGLAELDETGVVPTSQLSDMPDWLNAPGAGGHNAIYRGKYLGDSVTEEQYAAINDGTFDGLYIGDYWTISGINYRIAAFDYYLTTGDGSNICETHHVTLVPDSSMYTHAMNDTDDTTGAYVGSKMYQTGLNQAKATINAAFGEDHILNHRQMLDNAVTNNYVSGGSWYDSTVELMTEQNLYGGKVFSSYQTNSYYPAQYTVDKSQYPLFTFRPDMITNRNLFWLRDVVSSSQFAVGSNDGMASYFTASQPFGVRPAFSIKA